MSLTSLPVEVLEQVLKHVLFSKGRRPTALLRTNKFINEICIPMLHSDLVFCSLAQISLFSSQCLLAIPPRTISLSLPGAVVESFVFAHLHEAILRCLHFFPSLQKLQLHAMRFCLNSHPLDTNRESLSQALSLIDPLVFEWTSPDPDHHFSICIVPQAAEGLFRAFTLWTRLRRLKLCRLSFPPVVACNAAGPTLASSLCVTDPFKDRLAQAYATRNTQNLYYDASFRTQTLSDLHTIELNQVIFLDPAEVARLACAPSLFRSLRKLSVVDAYQDSIWGPRVRLSDVESAIRKRFAAVGDPIPFDVGMHSDSNVVVNDTSLHYERFGDINSYLARVREVVSCEAKVDRIMGGDRADTVS